MNSKKQELVNDRLKLIKEISKLRENFRGIDKIEQTLDNKFKHPYLSFSSLRVYLSLTCFDILGQSDEWVPFNNWLTSKRKKIERETILESHKSLDFNKAIISVFESYNQIYGVRNSFLNFIWNVLSDEQRIKLFDSIKCSRQLTPEIKHKDGSITIATGIRHELTDDEKVAFLYKTRNSFTHKGAIIGDAAGGIFKTEEPVLINDKQTWLYNAIWTIKKGRQTYTYSVRKWPFVLIEILENVVNHQK